MTKAVLLDSCELGDMCHPTDKDALLCREWAQNLKRKGTLLRIPDIVDYEVRRSFILGGCHEAIGILDQLRAIHGTLPVCEESLKQAAIFWARLRTGLRMAGTDDKRLDADVIICGQAWVFAEQEGVKVQIATDNIRHFQPLVDGTRIVDAKPWADIVP